MTTQPSLAHDAPFSCRPAVLAILLLALVAGACSAGPSPRAPRSLEPVPESSPFSISQLDPDRPLPRDPAVTKGVLDNGLTYFIRANQQPANRAEIWLVVDAGSTLEDDDQRGLAHFVEHMAFNGTRRFAEQELVNYLETLGMRFGPDVNAYTAFDETVYQLRVPTDQPEVLGTAFDILEDWASAITFDPVEVDKERGVIIEEWRLGLGPEARLRDQLFPILFQGSRYAERLPIGDPEIIRSAPVEALERYYRDWYRPDLMAVIAVGDFDPTAIEEQIREHFAHLENPVDARPRLRYEVPGHEETLMGQVTDPELALTTVDIYTKLERSPEGDLRHYRQRLVEGFFHQMLNDRLYERGQVAEPPFVYAFSNSGALVRTADVHQQEAGVVGQEVEAGLKALLEEVERVQRYGFTEGELTRAKNEMIHFFDKAFVERDNWESGLYAEEYVRAFLEGEAIPGIAMETLIGKLVIEDITLEEVNRSAERWTRDDNRVILVTAPDTVEASLPSEERLAALFEEVEAGELEAYEDVVPSAPLMAERPTPGTRVSSSEIPELGITEWELSNGVRVILKPTDFREDQVLIEGFSPGGHSLVADEDFLSASLATDLMGLGGLGELSELELGKILTGRGSNVDAWIDETEEGVAAVASGSDLETTFQLIHLTLTAPRADEAAFQGLLSQMRPLLENRLEQPEVAFLDALSKALVADHPRRRPLTVDRLDELDLGVAEEVYRDRFGDASDFTFVIVGSFDLEDIEEPVLTYLGSLPASGREETWRDVGAVNTEGPARFTVTRGLEPKARVLMIYRGDETWTREAAYGLDSLASTLELRLREVLREERGATYNVAVRGDVEGKPENRFEVTFQWSCAPERVEDLVAETREVLAAFRRGEIDPALVTKVQEMQRRQRELSLQENRFWRGVLSSFYRRGDDPRVILAHGELVDSLGVETLQAAAQRYLQPDQEVVGVLLPEDRSAQAAPGASSEGETEPSPEPSGEPSPEPGSQAPAAAAGGGASGW